MKAVKPVHMVWRKYHCQKVGSSILSKVLVMMDANYTLPAEIFK